MATPMMRAGIATEAGIGIHEIARPTPTDEQILVRVAAAGLNRADLGVAKSASGAPLTQVGLEWSGEVVAVGGRVTTVKPGEFVMCTGAGGYAEYAVTDAGRAIPFDPAQMSPQQAAALPLALMTAHDALITRGRLKAGHQVLVHGATSGVGLMALQMARLLGAPLIAATSRDAQKRARLAAFGATHVLDAGNASWADELLRATGNRGVDVVVDMVSGESINAAMKATSVLGRIVNVGRLGGGVAPFNFDLHALRRIEYIGVTFRTRSVEEVREIVARMCVDVLPAVHAGKLSLPVDKVFKLDEAAAAHAAMAANTHFGKILLVP